MVRTHFSFVILLLYLCVLILQLKFPAMVQVTSVVVEYLLMHIVRRKDCNSPLQCGLQLNVPFLII